MSVYRKLTSEINYIGKNINSLIREGKCRWFLLR